MDGHRQIRLITFRVGAELFVLDIMAVRQIIGYSGSRLVPHAPAFIEGIAVLRNEVIPIIDLRSRFFPDLPPLEGQPFVLVTRTPAGILGLKVDEVLRILNVDTESILPPPEIVRGLEGDLFIGVIPVGNELYLVIDLESILTGKESRLLEQSHLGESRKTPPEAANRAS